MSKRKKVISERAKKGVANILNSTLEQCGYKEIEKNINFDDIRILHKKEAYRIDSPNDLESTIAFLSELADKPNESIAWRFNYKGKKYSNGLDGKRSNPLTDKHIILLMQNMVDSMKALVFKD